MAKVKFARGTQSAYDALAVKDPDTLYFIIDTHKIYCGNVLFGTGFIDGLEQSNSGGTSTPVTMDAGGAPLPTEG